MTTYTDRNFRSKKALKEAVSAGEQVTYHNPGLGSPATDGVVYISGPHYPKPHTWYAECQVKGGVIVKVK